MLAGWDHAEPGRVANIFRALQNVALSQLGDTARFDFSGMQIDRSAPKAEYMFTEARVTASGLSPDARLFNASRN